MVIQESFLVLAAAGWHVDARRVFLEATAPEPLAHRLTTMTFAAGAFSEDGITGVILMPSPSLLGLSLCTRAGCAWELVKHYGNRLEHISRQDFRRSTPLS
jgi:hypothetical protein